MKNFACAPRKNLYAFLKSIKKELATQRRRALEVTHCEEKPQKGGAAKREKKDEETSEEKTKHEKVCPKVFYFVMRGLRFANGPPPSQNKPRRDEEKEKVTAALAAAQPGCCFRNSFSPLILVSAPA